MMGMSDRDPYEKRRGRGRGESRWSPRRIDARLRQVRAIEMRTAGATCREIAAACGYKTPSGASKAIWRAIREVNADERVRAQRQRDRVQAVRDRCERWCRENGCTPPNWKAIDAGDVDGWLDP